MKFDNNTRRFYELLAEGMHCSMIFNKLSQIYGSLTEEIKVNKELLITLINNKLIDLNHLNELSYGVDGNEQVGRIAHYLIHNVNHYRRLKNFLFFHSRVDQGHQLGGRFRRDLDIETFPCKKIEEKIEADMAKDFAISIKLILL